MAIFKIHDGKLEHIESVPFKTEKEIQTITEDNLEEVFGLDFVKRELVLNNFRVDTLAFDRQAKAFVIIEYKKDTSFSVVDQGYAYLALMLNKKADFVLEYNEKYSANMRKNDVDWSQSRVVFVSPTFTSYQRQAINFKDLPFELWELRKYSNETISYTKIQATNTNESIATVSKGEGNIQEVISEIKVYTVEKLLEGSSDAVRDAYFLLREEIYQVDGNAEERPAKTMIGYYSYGRGLLWIHPQKNRITIHLRKGTYTDKYGKLKYGGLGGYPVINLAENDFDIVYLRGLIKQAYEH